MKLAMVGLGRMGGNMVRRMVKGGHECVVFDRDPAKIDELVKEGGGRIQGARSLEELRSRLDRPAIAWIMLPAGEITESTVGALAKVFNRGDILIDGGNSYFKDDVRRARGVCAERGIRYVDVGTSGGVWGLERGYSLMIGGDAEAVSHLEPIFRALAPLPEDAAITPAAGAVSTLRTGTEGYLHCGPPGSGHFVKMIHNGIEYGMMQALAEGFHILSGAKGEELPEELRFDLDLPAVAEVWRRGSVVASWLLDLTALALKKDPQLRGFVGSVADSGEGRWTVQAAVEEGVPSPVIAASLFARFRSREESDFADQLLSAMRNQFGGHAEAPRKKFS